MAEYIEREKTVELLRSLGNREYRKEKGTIQDAIKMISYPEYTPTADVAPVVHGRWVSVAGKRDRICSWCLHNEPYKNADDDAEVFEFCPHCGAKMDGGDSDEAD